MLVVPLDTTHRTICAASEVYNIKNMPFLILRLKTNINSTLIITRDKTAGTELCLGA